VPRKVVRKRMSDERWERLLRSWATVLGLSDTTTRLAKEFFQRIRRARVWGTSSLVVAIYVASIVTGEYVPLPVLVRRAGEYRPVLGRMIYNKMRYNAKKLFGVDLGIARVVEVEIRGWCRVLRLDPVLCEASVCTAVNTIQNIFGRVGYARFVALILRFVAKRLGISLPHPRLLPQSYIHRKPVVFKRAEKYVDACIERARRAVAMQLQ
jgi:hypothetical protein